MQREEDRAGIEEMVGRAIASGNLRQNNLGPCHLDKLGALGMVGITEKLADSVFRLKYANDAKGYADAMAGVVSLANTLSSKNNWRLRGPRLQRMAKRVLHYWLSDICPLCSGVGYEVIRGSPHLSDRACPACHGARKRPMPWLKPFPKMPEGRGSNERRKMWVKVCDKMRRMQDQRRTLLVELEKVERFIGAKVIAKLASRL